MGMRPNNYNWLKVGMAINVYRPDGSICDSFVLRKKEESSRSSKLYVYEYTNDPWGIGLGRGDYYALPQDLRLLNTTRRWV